MDDPKAAKGDAGHLISLQNRQLNTTVDIMFPKPLSLHAANLEQFAQLALDRFSEYGLLANQIYKREGDRLFDYDLNFAVFNRNGFLRFTHEKLTVILQNAREASDLKLLQACIIKATECVPEVQETGIIVTSHAAFESKDEQQKFLAASADKDREITFQGMLFHAKTGAFPFEVKLAVDRSVAFSDGLFLSWSTVWRAGKITMEGLRQLEETGGSILSKAGLRLK